MDPGARPQPVPDLLGSHRTPLPLRPGDQGAGRRHAEGARQADPLENLSAPHVRDDIRVPTLTEAALATRTGDVWLFRGRSVADRTIRTFTNAPVNHVGMALVLEDLPPLLWHAELGRSLPDVWTGEHQRGVQLHDLVDAVTCWSQRYGQQAWLRQLNGVVTAEMEDAALHIVARLDGTPFPSTVALVGGWARARLVRRRAPGRPQAPASGRAAGRRPGLHRSAAAETAFCADVLARTYQAMGLLGGDRPSAFYDPGNFWSGDSLELAAGFGLGPEVIVEDVTPAGRDHGD